MPARTSKEPLSRERVLDAALVVADRDGLGALTMRRVADELDCEAMSLYYYVKDKASLLAALTAAIIDLVIDETLGTGVALPTSGEPTSARQCGADWRTTIRDRCLGAAG
jgi:AcrR family transcriptional regulator